ncbi:hypothetical protein YPPY34_4553, partial [Yersinia pestis PY-34]|jgi:hypothetical protein
MNN